MERDRARPVGARLEQRLVPDLRGRAHVGEHQRRARVLDRRDDLRQQLACRCVPPTGSARSSAGAPCRSRSSWRRGPRRCARAQRCPTPTRHASASSRLASVADRPHARKCRAQRAQPRERQLHLHAALRRQQLVPFVDDHRLHVREALAPVGARQQQRQALRRGDERGRQPAVLARARRRRRVAGAHADRPVRAAARRRRA